MGPRRSSIELDDRDLRVRLGLAFRARIPRAAVRAARMGGRRHGVGVHGWRGRWLVNTSLRGIVTLELDPPVRARFNGIPLRLRELRLSVDHPDAFVAALS